MVHANVHTCSECPMIDHHHKAFKPHWWCQHPEMEQAQNEDWNKWDEDVHPECPLRESPLTIHFKPYKKEK